MTMQQLEELRADAQDRAGRDFVHGRRPAKWPIALAVTAAAAIAFWSWSARWQMPSNSPAIAARPAAPASAPAPVATGPAFPLDTSKATPLSASDIGPALVELLGTRAVQSFLELDDFPRRIVATIDNLGRSQAPTSVWPVRPMPGQFSVDAGPQGAVIAASNADRYAPLLRLVNSIDAKKAAALYARMYPLLQQAYRELGFRQRYLNDRVIQVLDVLLATPEPAEPPRVALVEVKGPIAPTRPWVRYQYVDPNLEGLTAGQKILVRVGLAHERRLKRKLAEFRNQIALATAEGAAGR